MVMNTFRHLTELAFMAALLAFPVFGQVTDDKLPPAITTRGEAIVEAQPDRAEISIGVATEADTSQAAVEQNAKKAEATIARLRQVLGAGTDIKTVTYWVSARYSNPKEGAPSITSYLAMNIVRVTIDDLSLIGKAIDAATQAGANGIKNLQFTLKDDSKVKTRALSEAAREARRKADVLASTLGVSIVRVLRAVESSPVMRPVPNMTYSRAESASTPIVSGTIEIRAEVTLTVEIR